MTPIEQAREALKPCPFCSGEAERLELTDEDNFGGSVICCKACGASSPVHFDRKENLDDSWNRRARLSPSTPVDGVGAEQRVKPLEWVDRSDQEEGYCYYGFGVFGHTFTIKIEKTRYWGAYTAQGGKSRLIGWFDTKATAQSAAQADYKTRILSALASPEAEARLRERVAICDCERGHNGIGLSGRECDCQSVNDGWQAEAEAQAMALAERAGIDTDDHGNFLVDLATTLIEFAEARLAQADDKPSQSGSAFVFSEGVLYVNKDGSGYIAVKENDFRIETEYGEDGERSDYWISRLPSGELESLRDFLNGAPVAAEARLAQAEGGPALMEAMRTFISNARAWLDSRSDHAKPGWMVAQLPALEAALHPQSAAGEEGKP